MPFGLSLSKQDIEKSKQQKFKIRCKNFFINLDKTCQNQTAYNLMWFT